MQSNPQVKVYAESNRFILREILPTDIDELFELDADPEVHQYLGNKPVTSREQIAHVINFIRKQYTENGIGRWAIIDKRTNEFIGWSGLKYVTETVNNHQFYYDLGYRLKRKYWGQGIATETAMSAIVYAFCVLNLDVLHAAANCDNAASIRVLQKLGFKLVESFYYEDIYCHWYKLEKVDFEKNRP